MTGFDRDGRDLAGKISEELKKKRKSRKRRGALRAASGAALLLAALILAGVVVYRNWDRIDPKRLTLGLVAEEYGLSMEKMAASAGVTARYAAFQKGLAAATTDGIYYVTQSGQGGFRYDVKLATPELAAEGSFILGYDSGGKEAVILDRKGTANTIEPSGAILCAGLNQKGRSALVTAPSGYKSSVEAYDEKGARLFSWKTSDYYCVSAAVSESGASVAAAAVYTGGGVAEFRLLVFSIYKEGPIAEVALKDGLAVHVSAAGGGFLLITEGEIAAFSEQGERTGGVEFETAELKGFTGDGEGGFFLWLRLSAIESKHRVIHVSAAGLETGRLDTAMDVLSVASGGGRLALVSSGEINVYESMKLVKKIDKNRSTSRVALLSDGAVLLFSDKLTVIS